jgi:hypothetical protein
MAQTNEHLAHYRRILAQMKDDLASLESGRFSVAEKIKNGRVDVTRDWITELKDRIENLKRVIAAHDRRNA